MRIFLRAVLTGFAALVVAAGPSPTSSTFSHSPSPSPSEPAPTAVAVGERTRPRAYARPYIQRVWLPAVRDPAGFRANHSQSIRNFALAINDTSTFLRFLKEEEQRLGLRLGTDEETFRDAEVGDGMGEGEGETSLADAASAFASAANAASASASGASRASAGSSMSASAEGSEYEYDNSLSADRERTVPPTTTTASPPSPSPSTTSAPWVLLDRRGEGRQPRAHWFRPRSPLPPSSSSSDEDDAATPATALPFFAYTSTLRSYRGLTAAPSEIRNRTTPYTVTPVASFVDPNASFVYETYANRYSSSSPSSLDGFPDEGLLLPRATAGKLDAQPNKVSLSDDASSSRADSLPEAEALVAESNSQAEQSQYAAYADADRRLRNGVSSSSQDLSDASYFSISNEGPETEEVSGGDGAPSAYAAYPAVEYREVRRPDSGHAGPYDFGSRDVAEGGDASTSGGVEEFRNRPMVPMADVPTYNLQTAPRRSNRSRQHDPMVMSPSTIAPHIVEVFSVSPGTYFLSSTVQPPFDNDTEVPAEYHQAPSFNHFVESSGGYSEYRSANQVRTEKKHSARYQSAAVAAANNPLSNYNPFSIFPKYRATFVPRKEHSVKVLSGNPPPAPPAQPPPTLISYIEEPFAQLEERRSLAASRGTSGNLAPTDTSPSSSSSSSSTDASPADDSTVQQSSVTVSTATASRALPAAAYYSRVGGRAHGRAGPHGLSARARRPKARRRHRKSHHHAHHHRARGRGRSRAAAHFGVARMLLPPPVSRKVARVAVGVTVAPRVPETWQWQEGLMQPDEHFNDATADGFPEQPHHHTAPTHAPTFSPTYSSSSSVSSPAYSPTYSPTYAPSYSPTYSPTYAPTAFASTVTASPPPPPPPPPPPSPTHLLPTQASPSPLVAGAEREGRGGKAGRRALRTPKHPRHRAGAGPNALDGLFASEETQYRRRVKEKMALGHFRPEGIGEHGSIPGEPGVDYPTYSKPPVPSISCLNFKGRRGYVADPSTRCQVFYICPGDGRGKAMLCPNGTVFNQDVTVCDWWFNVKCSEP